jgi:methylated-DNA-[protein]-cysteine S-methyltransferase
MADTAGDETLLVFPSSLGWFAVCAAGKFVRRLTFGRRSAEAAVRALGLRLPPSRPDDWWQRSLVLRLQAYAEGLPMDFRDIHLDLARWSGFQQAVLRRCRAILYGQTMTYGELAAAAGAPRAARAVGNCMAANPMPLLIPCHRVIPATGWYGWYSAPGGTRMKQRLLALEARYSSRSA